MAEKTEISWTDSTANFWWGCFKVSPGCKNCYAETLSHRFGKNIWGPVATTDRELKENIWKELPKWNAKAKADGVRRRVFVQSMSDFFEDHPQVVETRLRAMRLIEELDGLDFLILTKRPENVRAMAIRWLGFGFPENVWIGTSVENQEMANKRIPELLEIPAKVRFLSMEPLLGSVDLTIGLGGADGTGLGGYGLRSAIDWVIVGGESGHHDRETYPEWVRAIRDQCQAAGVPFFFKQWGDAKPDVLEVRAWERAGRNFSAKKGGRILDGREWSEFPVVEVTK